MNPIEKRRVVNDGLANAIAKTKGTGGLCVVIDRSGDVHVAFLAPPSRVDALKILGCMPSIVESLATQIVDRLPAARVTA